MNFSGRLVYDFNWNYCDQVYEVDRLTIRHLNVYVYELAFFVRFDVENALSVL